MAEVSVREFSETVGTPIDRLLAQLNEAGLPHVAEADLLSDQDKEKLLSYLRRVHGKDDEVAGRSPRKKITLKRRQVSEISIAPSPRETRGAGGRLAGRKRTVKVDVLRSRTYVRPSDEPAGPTVEALREQEAAKSHLVEEARAHRRTLDERLRVDNEARAEEEVRRRRELVEAEARERELAEARAREAEEEAARAAAAEAAAKEAAAVETASVVDAGESASVPPPAVAESAPSDAAAASKSARKEPSQPPIREPGRSEPRRNERKGRKDRGELHVRSDRSGRRRSRPRRQLRRTVATPTQHIFERPTGPVVREVSVPEAITVGELAHAMSIKAAEVLKTLMNLGSMVTINQTLDQDTATLVVEEMGHVARPINTNALEEEVIAAAQTDDGDSLPRRSGGDRDGSRRPRQDVAARPHPQHRRGGRRSGWNHPAYRRLPRGDRTRGGHVPRHPGPCRVHRDAGTGVEGHRHRDPGRGGGRRGDAADRRGDSALEGGGRSNRRGRQQDRPRGCAARTGHAGAGRKGAQCPSRGVETRYSSTCPP